MFVEQITLYEWIIIILVPLSVGSVIKTWLVNRENALLTARLTKTERYLKQLESDWEALKNEQDRVKHFQNSLDEAELATRMQQPRMHAIEGGSQGNTPEKYRYIRSLHEKGMSAEEIASILKISSLEAEQLVSLAKIAGDT